MTPSPADPDHPPGIMLSAGEVSGDSHGATLCRALAALAPDWHLYGMGGARMAEAGMELVVDVTPHAVVGVTEALGRLPALYRAYRTLVARLRQRPRPRVLVLIDFPEFNLRLARAAGQAGVPVVYFVPPQVWAWRTGRARTLARRCVRVLATFPFEVPLYEAAGVPVEFVGHPVVDALASAPSRLAARQQLGLKRDGLVVGLLPGSRVREVERLLPAMRDAATRIARAHPDAQHVLALAPTLSRRAIADRLGDDGAILVAEDSAHAVMAAADLVLVASGTASLEAAILGTPMIVCYRVSTLTARLFLLYIRIPWIGLPNIVLGRSVVPELYQQHASGPRLGREALRILADPGELARQRSAFAELRGLFGPAGVGARAARAVLRAAGAPGESLGVERP